LKKVYTVGETVLDILFKNGTAFFSTPGGSMLNTSITLSVLKVPVMFQSEICRDRAGRSIIDYLLKKNVNIDNVYVYEDGFTPVALAFINDASDAEYQFFKYSPSRRLDFGEIEPCAGDIILFGSFYSLNEDLRKSLVPFLRKASEKNAKIFYDPNFRKSHSGELHLKKSYIEENLSMSDIVRLSNEDAENIFGEQDGDKIYEKIREFGCNIVIYTTGGNDIFLYNGNIKKKYNVPKIVPVSTVGAGDNFNAGIIYSLYNYSAEDVDFWDRAVQNGITLSSEICKRNDNYISEEFAEIFLKNGVYVKSQNNTKN